MSPQTQFFCGSVTRVAATSKELQKARYHQTPLLINANHIHNATLLGAWGLSILLDHQSTTLFFVGFFLYSLSVSSLVDVSINTPQASLRPIPLDVPPLSNLIPVPFLLNFAVPFRAYLTYPPSCHPLSGCTPESS